MKSEKEKMLAGEPYLALDKELAADRLRARELLKQLNIDHYLITKESALVLRKLLPNSHKSLYVEPPFHCDYGFNIFCEERVYFNVNCVVLDVAKVSIGRYTLFGPGVHIYTATHPMNAAERKILQSAKPVSIGENCWIGGGAIILPGVTIGDNSVVAAGAVVNRDVPANSLAAGNPAVVKKSVT